MINMVFICLDQILANEAILSKTTVLEFIYKGHLAYIEIFEKTCLLLEAKK